MQRQPLENFRPRSNIRGIGSGVREGVEMNGKGMSPDELVERNECSEGRIAEVLQVKGLKRKPLALCRTSDPLRA
uniref:Uncharacterized protein n=1 Tax=Vespula pensylvanica TaxID=30213 RepID=A0A834UC20_VESPE|nr:hypothetical protein H0235_005905 [Vespula pensylvanica]